MCILCVYKICPRSYDRRPRENISYKMQFISRISSNISSLSWEVQELWLFKDEEYKLIYIENNEIALLKDTTTYDWKS